MTLRSYIGSGLSAVVGIGVGLAAAAYVPIAVWKPIFPGLLVALSMLGAAVLVRLARNAPITAPTTFDDEDLKRFFDALEELNRRLYWMFIQVLVAIFLVLFALCLTSYGGALFGLTKEISKTCSGSLGFLLVWLVTRLLTMANGDIGFVRLQRQILQNALIRQRKAAAEKITTLPVVNRSPGGYGRAL